MNQSFLLMTIMSLSSLGAQEAEMRRGQFRDLDRQLGSLYKPLLLFEQKDQGLFKAPLDKTRIEKWDKTIEAVENFILKYARGDDTLIKAFMHLKKITYQLINQIKLAYTLHLLKPDTISSHQQVGATEKAFDTFAEQTRGFSKYYSFFPYRNEDKKDAKKLLETFQKTVEAIILSVKQAFTNEIKARQTQTKKT